LLISWISRHKKLNIKNISSAIQDVKLMTETYKFSCVKSFATTEDTRSSKLVNTSYLIGCLMKCHIGFCYDVEERGGGERKRYC